MDVSIAGPGSVSERTHHARRWVVILAGLAVVLIVAVTTVYAGMVPGRGPLTDPGSLQPNAGFTGGSGTVSPGSDFSYSLLNIVNGSRVGATVDGITLANASPGLHLIGAWVAHRGAHASPRTRWR
jgi:hypothetical protein